MKHVLYKVENERFVKRLFYGPLKRNMFQRDFYSPFGLTDILARPDMHELLMKTAPELKKRGLFLCIYDLYRPWIVQKEMYEGAPENFKEYIAPPPQDDSPDGLHPRAAAVDCFLLDADGNEMAFPSPPDAYYKGWENDPDFEKVLLACHRDFMDAPPQMLANRRMLQDIMCAAGLEGDPTEWWHFNLPGPAQQYPVIRSLDDAVVKTP